MPHADTADVLLSQEVSDLHQRARLLHDHINRKMGIYRSHFVPEALGNKSTMHLFPYLLNVTGKRLRSQTHHYTPYQGDPLDHVLDMTADSADCGQLLSITPPLIHTQLKNSIKTHLKSAGITLLPT